MEAESQKFPLTQVLHIAGLFICTTALTSHTEKHFIDVKTKAHVTMAVRSVMRARKSAEQIMIDCPDPSNSSNYRLLLYCQ
jgi:hypothetical protein